MYLHRRIADDALHLLGVPYRRGGTSPRRGFDCSGLVHYVFAHAVHILLPRTVRGLSRVGKWVSRRHLQVGDLLLFHTQRPRFSHVGIYIGDGEFVHAPRPGARVQVGSLRDPYWRRHFTGARRINVIGRTLRQNNSGFTAVATAP